MRTFGGVWPALVTPFTPDDQVSTALLRKLVDHFVARHLDGLYICGSTGEGVFMSAEERELVVETVLDQAQGRLPVIVHVGAAATLDAVRLARHAQSAGAAGISAILPPVAFDPRSVVAHFDAIAAAVPDLPFLPYVFGGPRDAIALMRDLVHIPNLAGTKYFGPNMYEFGHLVEAHSEGWTAFSGMDEQCIFAAMFGAHGCIGSTINLIPGVFQQIYSCFRAGDLQGALEMQKRANRVIDVLHSYGFMGAFKDALGYVGLECGQPRRPNIPLAAEKRAELRAKLDAAGLAELAAM
jgi:N-acetylneuraminate lyase